MSKIEPNFRQRITLSLFSKYANAQTQLHDLSYLFWECTLRCNINCLHCGSDCHKDSSYTDMPAADFLKVTSQIAKKHNPNKIMVVITGGEPLVRKDLEYVGKELYNQGYPWGFVTNGYAFNEQRFKQLMNSGLRSVTVSLDGFEEEHNWLRGKNDSFNRAVNAIKLIVNEPDLIYDIVTCVNQQNFNKLPELKDFLINLGVKKWRLFTIFPIGRAKENKLLDISNEQMLKLMNFIKDSRKQGLIKVSYGCEGYLGSFDNEVRDGHYFCRAGINIGSVLVDGSISACPNINRKFIQGNIYNDNFLDVWSNKYPQFRDRNWTKTGKCSNCESFKYCKGNGIHLHDPDNENVLRCHFEMLKNAKIDK